MTCKVCNSNRPEEFGEIIEIRDECAVFICDLCLLKICEADTIHINYIETKN